MKKLFLALLVCFSVTSCKKDDDSSGSPSAFDITITPGGSYDTFKAFISWEEAIDPQGSTVKYDVFFNEEGEEVDFQSIIGNELIYEISDSEKKCFIKIIAIDEQGDRTVSELEFRLSDFMPDNGVPSKVDVSYANTPIQQSCDGKLFRIDIKWTDAIDPQGSAIKYNVYLVTDGVSRLKRKKLNNQIVGMLIDDVFKEYVIRIEAVDNQFEKSISDFRLELAEEIYEYPRTDLKILEIGIDYVTFSSNQLQNFVTRDHTSLFDELYVYKEYPLGIAYGESGGINGCPFVEFRVIKDDVFHDGVTTYTFSGLSDNSPYVLVFDVNDPFSRICWAENEKIGFRTLSKGSDTYQEVFEIARQEELNWFIGSNVSRLKSLDIFSSTNDLCRSINCTTLVNDLSYLGGIKKVLNNVSIVIEYCDGATMSNNLLGLHDLEEIGGDFRIEGIDGVLNLDNLEKITSIGGDLIIKNCKDLKDFCGIQNLIQNGGVAGQIQISGNLYNPTVEDIVTGNCSQ